MLHTYIHKNYIEEKITHSKLTPRNKGIKEVKK